MSFIETVRPDTVTLGQFFVEDNAPVKGPNMAEYNLVGDQTHWIHRTMTSKTADGLIAKGLQQLEKCKIAVGNEYDIASRMSMGLTFEEAQKHFTASRILLDQSTSSESRA